MLIIQTTEFLKSAGYGEYCHKVNSTINAFYKCTKGIEGEQYLLNLVNKDFKDRIKENKRNLPETVKNTLGDAIKKAYMSRLHDKPYDGVSRI